MMLKPTIGSLFAGIGGIDYGFECAGFATNWQVEIDDFCNLILAKNFPKVTRFRDIRTCDESNLNKVDVVVGGFPCQDISTAGLRKGFNGTRSSLWFAMSRIISKLRPPFALIENVATIRNKDVDVFERVLWDLAALRYDVEWHCIPASAIGAPHTRDRIWIVAADTLRSVSSAEQKCERNQMGWLQRTLADGLVWSLAGQKNGSWGIGAGICRAIDGLSCRLDRHRVLGNAVVPEIPELIAYCLRERISYLLPEGR